MIRKLNSFEGYKMKNKFLSCLSPPERAAINLLFLVFPSKRRNCAYLCAECKYTRTLFEVSLKAVMFHTCFPSDDVCFYSLNRS